MCGLIQHYPFACIREASLHIGRLLCLTFCVSRLAHGTHIFPLSRQSPQTPPRPKRKASYDVVLFDGIPYTTLPWFLGKVPIKSEKKKVDACGFTSLVQLKNGNHTTLARYIGQELLGSSSLASFRQHKWVSTTCTPTREDRGSMQCRVISDGCVASSNNFLCKVSDLSRAFACAL